MEYRQTNNSHTRGARVHAYAVRGLLRPLRWGYASLLVLELCFTVRADRVGRLQRIREIFTTLEMSEFRNFAAFDINKELGGRVLTSPLHPVAVAGQQGL